MDMVTCSCMNCRSFIGNFENQWNKIGKKHFSPIHFDTDEIPDGLDRVGEIRRGPDASILRDTELEDLVCKGCATKLGFLCLDAPLGHILQRGQIFLHLENMTVISTKTGKKANLVVNESYSLKDSIRSNNIPRQSDAPSSAERLHGRQRQLSDDEDLEPDLDDLDDEARLQKISHFSEWAEDAINGQRQDIDRISASVNKIQQEMRGLKDLMSSIKKDLRTKANNTELLELKQGIEALHEDVEVSKSRPNGISDDVTDLMTESITKLSQKVNEVDSLQLEIQFLKSRLKRLEDASSQEKSTDSPSRYRSETPAYGSRPLTQQLQRTAVTKILESNGNPTSDIGANKRKRADTENSNSFSMPAPKGARNTSICRPSRLSNVQLPEFGARPASPELDDYSGMTCVNDDDVFAIPKYLVSGIAPKANMGNGSLSCKNSQSSEQNSYAAPKRPARPSSKLAVPETRENDDEDYDDDDDDDIFIPSSPPDATPTTRESQTCEYFRKDLNAHDSDPDAPDGYKGRRRSSRARATRRDIARTESQDDALYSQVRSRGLVRGCGRGGDRRSSRFLSKVKKALEEQGISPSPAASAEEIRLQAKKALEKSILERRGLSVLPASDTENRSQAKKASEEKGTSSLPGSATKNKEPIPVDTGLGVILTAAGVPDKRYIAGGKFIAQRQKVYERVMRQRSLGGAGQRQSSEFTGDSGAEGKEQDEQNEQERSRNLQVLIHQQSESQNEPIQSIETGLQFVDETKNVQNRVMGMEATDKERQATLEARDRLVRETLEKEMSGIA